VLTSGRGVNDVDHYIAQKALTHKTSDGVNCVRFTLESVRILGCGDENPTPSSEDKTGRGNERRYDSGALEP